MLKKALLTIIIVVAIAISGAWFVLGTDALILLLNFPSHDFEEDTMVSQPDYKSVDAWQLYAHSIQSQSQAAVFFIHPTGYFRSDRWNSPLNPNSAAEYNRRWMMANMAVVFDELSVYAPKYREATIYAFFDTGSNNGTAALALAYKDVQAAFAEFITHIGATTPFILAGHSQGSLHGLKLLKEIESSPYASRLVAAYLPGGTQASMLKGLNTELCGNESDTGCLLAWSTYSSKFELSNEELNDPYVCVNPISWRINGQAEIREHLGMVPEVGQVNTHVLGKDSIDFEPIPSIEKSRAAYTGARCDQGALRVEVPESEQFNTFNDGDYHNYDYGLFHMDIRNNVSVRVNSWQQANVR